MKLTTLACCFAASVLTSAYAGEPPAPLSVENTQTLSATVKSVDMQKRLVSLATEDGRTETIEAGPEVRNLAQVKVGDKVVVHYYEAIAAEFRAKGTSPTRGIIDATGSNTRAKAGQKPGAAAGATVTTTVVIDSVDQAANKVSFRGPSESLRTVEVKDPKARAFIQGLKNGDEVEVTYTEAVAVSVDPSR